jgi:hypothetical protein
MPKQKQKTKLEKQIKGSIFLREDLKEKLLANLEKASNEDMVMLVSMFGEAKKQQDKLVDKMAAYDDAFVPGVKHFIESEKSRYMKGVEKEHRKKEKTEELLKKIE